MSGRKKSGSAVKEKKGGLGKPQKSLPDIPLPTNVTELTKEFYTIQIKDLETRIFELRTRCQELETQNSELGETCEKQAADQRDIVEYLNAQLARKDSEIAALEEQIVQLESQKDAERDRYELELTTLATKSKEQTDQLTLQTDLFRQKLDELREFRHHKEEYEARTAALEIQLQEREREHTRIVNDLERKAVQDKDRLKKEMLQKVNEVISNFRDITDKQMAETTKRTIQENITINAQLTKMSAKTMELISQNEDLVASEKKLRLRVEILDQAEIEMAKKNRSQQKAIRLLLDRLRSAGSNADGIKLPEEPAVDANLGSKNLGGGAPLPPINGDGTQQHGERKHDDSEGGSVRQLERDLEEARAEAGRFADQATAARKEQERLMALLSDTASFMLVTLEEAKKQIGRDRMSASREEGGGGGSGRHSSSGRASVGKGRTGSADSRSSRQSSAAGGHAWSEKDPVPKTLSGLSAVEREKVLGFLLSRLNTFQTMRQPFTVGVAEGGGEEVHVDFHVGLVPRQGPSGSRSQATGKKVRSNESIRNVGVQTDSIPKAMFFAEQLVSRGAVPKETVPWDPQMVSQVSQGVDILTKSPSAHGSPVKSLRKSVG
eukprot:Opistho-2@69369